MGIETIVRDDLTGVELSDDTEPTTVTIDGEDYTVYLGTENKEGLIRWAKGEGPMPRARQAAPSTAPKASSNGSSGSTLKKYGFDAKEVREFAIANGLKTKGGQPITEQTRVLHQDLYDAYRDAQTK